MARKPEALPKSDPRQIWDNAVKLAEFMRLDKSSLNDRLALTSATMGILLSGIPSERRQAEMEAIFALIRKMTDVAAQAAPGVLPT